MEQSLRQPLIVHSRVINGVKFVAFDNCGLSHYYRNDQFARIKAEFEGVSMRGGAEDAGIVTSKTPIYNTRMGEYDIILAFSDMGGMLFNESEVKHAIRSARKRD